MKKYVRTNIVDAKPMTRGEYNRLRGWTLPVDENPNDDGYIILYRAGKEDEYVSWCPKRQFDEVSREVEGLSFGMAIEAMKQGCKVARRGWNGKGMWLCIPLVEGPKEIPATGIWGKPNVEYAEQNGGTVKVMPYITMKAADGSIVMGWLASQTDMLSDDWMIVE